MLLVTILLLLGKNYVTIFNGMHDVNGEVVLSDMTLRMWAQLSVLMSLS